MTPDLLVILVASPSTSIKLYCLVTEAGVREWLLLIVDSAVGENRTHDLFIVSRASSE